MELDVLVPLKCRRSLTGAWIETSAMMPPGNEGHVAPLRGRGLKRVGAISVFINQLSLPYGGVD